MKAPLLVGLGLPPSGNTFGMKTLRLLAELIGLGRHPDGTSPRRSRGSARVVMGANAVPIAFGVLCLVFGIASGSLWLAVAGAILSIFFSLVVFAIWDQQSEPM